MGLLIPRTLIGLLIAIIIAPPMPVSALLVVALRIGLITPAVTLVLARLRIARTVMLLIAVPGITPAKPLLARLLLALAELVLLALLLIVRLVGFRRGVGLARTERIVGLIVVAAIVVIAGLAVLTIGRLRLSELFLRRGDQAEIMLRVLIVIFRAHKVAGRLRIPCKLHVFFGNVGGASSNFDVGSVGFENPRQRILAFAVAAAHTFILNVISHGRFYFTTPVDGISKSPTGFNAPMAIARTNPALMQALMTYMP